MSLFRSEQLRALERDRVREALIALSVERGFQSLDLDDLLQGSGVDRDRFARTYSDLEDCFARIYEVQRDEFVAAVVAGFYSRQGWREQMRAAAWAMLEFLREDHERAYFMSCEVHGAGDRARIIRDEAMQGFFFLIDQGRAELADPDSLTPYTAESIGSAIYQQFQATIARWDFDGLEAMIPQMMYTALLPYLGPEAAAEELAIAPPPLRSAA
jgi:AcrR family transcriptional regulator